MQFAPFLAAHEGRRLADGKSRRSALDQRRSDAGKARTVTQVDEENLRFRAEGGKHLAAVDQVIGPFLPRAGFQIGDGRAGVGLGHAQTHDHAAGKQIGEPALLLRRRAVFGKGADRAEIAELHHVGAARANGGDLFDGDHGVHQRAALAAVLLRQRDAHKALFRHELRHVERKARIVGALERAIGELLAREAADLLGEQLLLFGEIEIHGGDSISITRCRASRLDCRTGTHAALRRFP